MSETQDTGQTQATGETGGAASSGTTDAREWLPAEYRADPKFANFSNVDQLAKSYSNAASMVGLDKNRLAVIPKDEDTDAWGRLYTQLGRPDTPEGYGIEASDPAAALWAQALPNIHKLGLTKKQVDGLRGQFREMEQAHIEKFADPGVAMETWMPKIAAAVSSEVFAAKTEAALKAEWGAAYDEKMHAGQRFVQSAIESGEAEIVKLFQTPDKGGYGLGNMPGIMAMAARLGEMMAESGRLVGGGAGGQSRTMTPGEASAEISRLRGDREFYEKLRNNDPDSVKRWNDLHAARGGVAA